MMVVRGLSGKEYQLSEKPFSSGGEGGIYGIANMPGGVVKVYHADRITQELEEKLLVMYRHPPNREIFTQIAWPVDVVYDRNGAFLGFVMFRLNITDELGAIYAYPPKKNISYKAKLIIAQNICAVISEVHKAGFVFGDFNPKNIGIDLNSCRVAFLDTDSYHIVDGARTYRCKVCLDGYVAPELLKKCEAYKTDAYASAPLPTFTPETDNFALAIHIFRLLMNGYTPFNGVRENESVSTASPGTGNQAIKRDNYCFKPGNKPQAVAVPPLSTLPEEIADLFTRAFMYGRIDPTQRPTAAEWHKALLKYENSLVSCPNNGAHMYQKGLQSCPWCEADNRYATLTAEPPTRPPAPPIPQKTFSGAVVPVTSPLTVVTPPSPVGVGQSSVGGITIQSPTVVTPPMTAGVGYGSPNNSSLGHSTVGTQPSGGSLGRSFTGHGASASSTNNPISIGTKRPKKNRQRTERKHRMIKYVAAAVFLVISVLATTAYMAVKDHQQEQYAQAEALLEAGSYSEAAAAFEELGGYGDAENRALDAMYQNAKALMEAGSYDEAITIFEKLSVHSDAEEQVLDAKYQRAVALLEAGDKSSAAMAFGALGDYQDARARSLMLWNEIAVRETISAGNEHVVGLKVDGTVVAAGRNTYGQCNVESWTDIIAVSAGVFSTVGLRADGTVVAVGENKYGECDVESWTDVVAISAGTSDTVGLKSDGTVMAVGYHQKEQKEVNSWTDIVAISADNIIVGLKSDGTVLGTGNQAVQDWTDIVAIYTKSQHILGLKSDGTVITAGHNYYGELNVDEWDSIVGISTGSSHTVGLKSDGSLVAVGSYGTHDVVESWTSIVAISAGTGFTVGLKTNGTVVSEGEGKLNVSDWSGIMLPSE